MFGAKKKKTEPADDQAGISPDLIVHNMPRPQRPAARNRRGAVSTSFTPVTAPPKNFQYVGLLIIGGGLLVIGAIAYFGYRFMIAPATAPAEQSASIPADEASDLTPVPVAPAPVFSEPLDLVFVEPAEIELAPRATDEGEEEQGSNMPPADLPLADRDGDGLGDDEELLLGTDPDQADTDNDGYSDGAELASLYNPRGLGRLGEDEYLKIYRRGADVSGSRLSYNLLYPGIFAVSESESSQTVVFAGPDGSLIQVAQIENTEEIGILSWYEANFPGSSPAYNRIKTTATWDGLMGDDGLNFYLVDKARSEIIVLSFIPATGNRLSYPNIFRLLIDTFRLEE